MDIIKTIGNAVEESLNDFVKVNLSLCCGKTMTATLGTSAVAQGSLESRERCLHFERLDRGLQLVSGGAGINTRMGNRLLIIDAKNNYVVSFLKKKSAFANEMRARRKWREGAAI